MIPSRGCEPSEWPVQNTGDYIEDEPAIKQAVRYIFPAGRVSPSPKQVKGESALNLRKTSYLILQCG